MHHLVNLELQSEGTPPKVNGSIYAFRRHLLDNLPNDISSDDEYVSAMIQATGYRLVYVPAARIETKDPTDMRDYLRKRVRILGGHRQIGKELGYRVPTLSIRCRLRVLGRTMRSVGLAPSFLLAMMSLELLASVIARLEARAGNYRSVYRSSSAKFREGELND